MSTLQLLGPDGQPIRSQDGLVPHVLTFSSVFNSTTATYAGRWDEAIRDNPQNALAMRQDVYLRGLLQERAAPTVNLGWQIEVDEPKNPRQQYAKKRLTELIRAIPRFQRLKQYLLEALWYGRYGSQLCWRKTLAGWTVSHPNPEVAHEPVNGDKIQYRYDGDGTPVILVQSQWANQQKQQYPDSIITTDRGGMGLVLNRQQWRDRFLIHTHQVEDADFFEGLMAGQVKGVGLRSIVYWGNWLRTQSLTWMLQFMESVGMMDLLIFNYADGSKKAEDAAAANARKITQKLAMLVPRDPKTQWAPVESIPANTAGIEAMRNLISEYFDRHIERLFVGQSMSAGADHSDGLGGTGRANLAKTTKGHLLSFDTQNLDETFTTQLIRSLCRYNPDIAEAWQYARYKSANPDSDRAEKLDVGLKLVQAGIAVKADELRDAAGYTKPDPDDEVIGGQTNPAQPTATPGLNPQANPGGTPAEQSAESPLSLLASWLNPVLYDMGQQWEPHTIQSGPRKGQQAFRHKLTGEIRDQAPTPQTSTPGEQGTPQQAGNIQSHPDDQQAAAKVSELPGLDEQERKGLLGAVKGIAQAGAKAVALAKAVTTTVYEEAKLWATRLQLAGVSYEDVFNDLDEMSNPLQATAAHNIDHVAAATGIPSASWIGLNLVPKIGTYAILKVKSMFKKKPEEPQASEMGLLFYEQDQANEVVRACRQALLTAIFKAIGITEPPSSAAAAAGT